ncbi:MAG: hypothetical protein MAG794_01544 [Gammaproteobacteria bacterium]|nr:hypothetical protein [Gammaproteobacteria bacterium]
MAAEAGGGGVPLAKGSRKNNFTEFAPEFGLDLDDPMEQNRSTRSLSDLVPLGINTHTFSGIGKADRQGTRAQDWPGQFKRA